METYNLIFTFYSTHLALEFENVLKANQIDVNIIPVPRQISSSCGLSGKIKLQDLEQVKKLAAENKIEYEDIYQVKDQDFKKISN
ncbi:DUF3343 domain-containing protein [Halanaerobium praevalens]|uniref:Putative Se/S carrier protein-like domain-containing protein n=1 Tax=Halanaerobium praevalens (strain ATCC 33744 / DSM 2228 / GSL) TaxID=572479 RepID=E3DM95_HALPG|nr:DUF3343 domain-containing protein [Halanaerobium praevalens]ADO76288.1 hypothetical protein Hprae_0130 [Halanaerobium praevalens DSM 2228]